MLWRKSGLSGAVFEPQFTGTDRPVFTEVSRKMLIWAVISRLAWSFSGFAASVGRARAGKALDLVT